MKDFMYKCWSSIRRTISGAAGVVYKISKVFLGVFATYLVSSALLSISTKVLGLLSSRVATVLIVATLAIVAVDRLIAAVYSVINTRHEINAWKEEMRIKYAA